MQCRIDFSQTDGRIGHVAAGALYGVTETLPDAEAIAAIKPKTVVNPPEAGIDMQQRVGEAIPVAKRLAPVGGAVQVRFADIYPGWYDYAGMDAWKRSIDKAVRRVMEAGLTNISGYEIWNEPDFSWHGEYLMPLSPEIHTYVIFEVHAPQGGVYHAAFGYANGATNEAVQLLRVNGEGEELRFPPTLSWMRAGGYHELTLELRLHAGVNLIRLDQVNGQIDLDRLLVTNAAPDCYEAEEAIRGGYVFAKSGHASSRASEHHTFNEFYTLSRQCVKKTDPSARVIAPSFAIYSHAAMYAFLKYQHERGTLPEVICWHQLSDEDFEANMADYRQIEKTLGIAPLPVTINEYSGGEWFYDEGAPGASLPLIAKFERRHVESACASYWNCPGRLGSLYTSTMKPNGGYWFYRWYADMEGTMPRVIPPDAHNPRAVDVLACLSDDETVITMLLGGETPSGEADILLKNLPDGFNGELSVCVEHVAFEDWGTAVAGCETVSRERRTAQSRTLRLALTSLKPKDGYRITIQKGER